MGYPIQLHDVIQLSAVKFDIETKRKSDTPNSLKGQVFVLKKNPAA